MVGPLGVHFALFFAGHRRWARAPAVVTLLYAPAIAFEVLSRVDVNRFELQYRPPWGWTTETPLPALGAIMGAWIVGLGVMTLTILTLYALRSAPGTPQRNQATLVAAGYAVPNVQGTITQFLFPAILGWDPLPLASTFMTAFSVCTFIALWRHGLLQLPTVEEQLRAAQLEMQQRARQLEEAQRIARVGSWEWDIAPNTVTWSDELYRIYGYEPNAFAVTYDKFLEGVHADDRARVDGFVKKAFNDCQPFEFDHRIVLPNGEVKTLHAQGSVTTDERGRPVRMRGTGHDVTEQRRAEAERERLARQQAELERLKAESLFRAQFINMAAHELNTPITPLKLQIHLLKTGRTVPLTSAQEHTLEILDRNVDRIAVLVRNMLDVGRIQAGRIDLKKEPMDLNGAIQHAAESFAEAAKQAGVDLSIWTTGDLWVQADALRVNQVLFNLLSNAIKFTPSGGRVLVEAATAHGEAFVTVRDTGAGLTRGQMDRLFQPFTQVHDSRQTGSRPGTGLGLFISKELVALHGGKMTVESPGPDQGSTFSFTLPEVLSAKGAPPAAPSPKDRGIGAGPVNREPRPAPVGIGNAAFAEFLWTP